MIEATEGRKNRYSIWRQGGLRSSDDLNIDGRSYKITNGQGFLVYQLLRGGIDDPLIISVALGIPVRELPDQSRLFLFFDNIPRIAESAPRDLPPLLKSCPIICKQCSIRCKSLPCDCGKPAALTISREEARENTWKSWCERDDRRWANASSRIQHSEATYHGDRHYHD